MHVMHVSNLLLPADCACVRDLGTARPAHVRSGRRGSWEDGGLGTLSEVGLGRCVARPAPGSERVTSSEAPTGMVALRLVYGRWGTGALSKAGRSSNARLELAWRAIQNCSGSLGTEGFWGRLGGSAFLLRPWGDLGGPFLAFTLRLKELLRSLNQTSRPGKTIKMCI